MTEKEAMYFVLLEFPEENVEETSWLRSYRIKVESICDEYCFKLGALYILPRTYLILVEDLLQKVEAEYRKKGYNPLFRVMHFSLCWEEYKEFLRMVLERIQSRLENYLKILEEKGPNGKLVPIIFKEVVRAKELTLIFQLERISQKEVMKLQDLAGILNERTIELKLSIGHEVEVREL